VRSALVGIGRADTGQRRRRLEARRRQLDLARRDRLLGDVLAKPEVRAESPRRRAQVVTGWLLVLEAPAPKGSSAR
jgi:hypothetical protein